MKATNQISFLQVHNAAENIAAIFARIDLSPATMHVTIDDYSSMPVITQLITRVHGHTFEYFEIPDAFQN